MESGFPLHAFIGWLIIVFELPLGDALAHTASQRLEQSVLTPVPGSPAGALDGVGAEKHLVPALTSAIRLLDGRPRAIIALGSDLISVFAADPFAAKFPVHWVLGVIAIAAVDDAVQALEALILVEVTGFAERHGHVVLVGGALVVGLGEVPALSVVGGFDAVAKVLVVFVHAVPVGVCLAALLLVAVEVVRLLAGRG